MTSGPTSSGPRWTTSWSGCGGPSRWAVIGRVAAGLTSDWSEQTIIDLEKKKLDLTHQERGLDNELEEEELRYRTMVRYI